MRCASKAAGIAAMRLRSAATGEAKTSQAADDNSPASSAAQPAEVASIGSQDDAPRGIRVYELELIYSGE